MPSADGVLWTGDIETGNISQFNTDPANDVGGTRPRVVTDPVRSGRYALALSIPGSTEPGEGICCGSRDEVKPRFRDLREGDDLWFGFSIYLAPGYPTSGGWQVVTQFKQNFDGSPPLSLNVEDDQYKIEGGYGYPGGSRLFVRPVGAAVTGEWVDWVMHVRFSANPAVGFVEAWRDGELVLPRMSPPGGTLYPGSGSRGGSYVKTGPYRDQAMTEPGTLYLDDWRIGTRRSALPD
jgi:hypothetical protein